MYNIDIQVYLKENILDPQGKAVHQALHQLGFSEVSSVRVGKYIRLQTEDIDNLEERIKSMCSQLLVNEVVEDMSFSIEKSDKS
jgi:phosphoribosylformylglycinamidine synthase PurS subunit